jgi:choline dehydrogenase
MYFKGLRVVAVALLSTFVAARPNSASLARHLTELQDTNTTYDYVIIGGGTSGLTVADRLTEAGNC